MAAGRPTDYNDEIAAKICGQLAEGISLKTVCKADDMPSTSTVFLWIQRHKEFSDKYAQAKAESADALTEEMLDIADNSSNDWMDANDPDNTGYKLNGEAIQRSRLRVDTRKWLASKPKPKKYGERVDLNHGGQPENPVITQSTLTPSEAYLKLIKGQ